ncbi:MAG TPA: hypothetical protein VFG22_10095 [Polyangiales bacterium]|nr:hypothetical protein [Polyangiales bacterium]
MRELSWPGALLGALTVLVPADLVAAQDDSAIDIITEPPAQTEPSAVEPPAPELGKPKEPLGHLRVGGGIGLGFATDFFSIGISPQVSYIIKRIVEPGLGLTYQFARDRVTIPETTWQTFGSSIFVRLYPIPQFFVLVEGELINTGWKQGDVSSGRMNYGNLLLGGGLLMGVGKGVFVATSLKVPVLRNPFYPTAFPIIAAGVGYSF